jgi:hypothetical protein
MSIFTAWPTFSAAWPFGDIPIRTAIKQARMVDLQTVISNLLCPETTAEVNYLLMRLNEC